MLVQCRRSTVDSQGWYNVGNQLAHPYSDCGKSIFPTVDVQGLSSVYSAPVVNCKISAFEQCLIIKVYNQYFRNVDSQRWKYVGYQYWCNVANWCCTNAVHRYHFDCPPTWQSDSDSQKLVSNVGSTLVRLLISVWVCGAKPGCFLLLFHWVEQLYTQ